MFGIILASMIAFLSTSIDDLFILTLHFATSNEKFSKKDIVYGHFSGIAFLISICSILFYFKIYISFLIFPKRKFVHFI
jgi:cadmium resistance protein CadD (predicted permease)